MVWCQRLASFVTSGFKTGLLSLSLGVIGIGMLNAVALAQLRPDKTLNGESSVVTPAVIRGLSSDRIDGGAIRGRNLFHSFKDFNVGVRPVYFANPNNIRTILTRITGTRPSRINNTLGVLGNADLFLINPHGILFGPNASLLLGGSFVATTANALQFGDQGSFSASAPRPPAVLTVHPDAFLFHQVAAQPANIKVNQSFLIVPGGQSLLLVGGNAAPTATATGAIKLDGGILFAPGGRIELGGLATKGQIGLERRGQHLSLQFPQDQTWADIVLTNGSAIGVLGQSGGDLVLTGQTIQLLQGSSLFAGIVPPGSRGAQAGNIVLNSTRQVLLDSSFLFNTVERDATGTAGQINITTDVLTLIGGSQLVANTLGQGNAGNINIQVRDQVNLDGSSTAAFSNVEPGARGNGGNINIITDTLMLTNGAQLVATTEGFGNAGTINIQTDGQILLNGSQNGLFSSIRATASGSGVGNGGDIAITTGSLEVSNGGQLVVSTLSQGNAGNITIQARDQVKLDGPSSAAFSTVEEGAVGNGGNISITTNSLNLTNGAQLIANTEGVGNAGSISIQAQGAVVLDGQGIVIQDGEEEPVFSAIFSTVEPFAQGRGGDLKITADSLTLSNGVQVAASTLGNGDAGGITIQTQNQVRLTNGARLLSAVEPESTGNGSDITLQVGSLSLADQVTISAESLASGTAGNLRLTAAEQIDLKDSEIVASALQSGGGEIQLQAPQIRLDQQSRISTSVFSGTGGGGNIAIATDSFTALADSDILANADEGEGGNITISARIFLAEGFSGLARSDLSGAIANFERFRGNDQVDISASSRVGTSGIVATPDLSALENSLTELSARFTSPDQLVAGSCLARRNAAQGSFVVTGTGGLPDTPDQVVGSEYVLSSIQSLPTAAAPLPAAPPERSVWHLGDPIQEAGGMIKTATGRLLLAPAGVMAIAPTPSLICDQ